MSTFKVNEIVFFKFLTNCIFIIIIIICIHIIKNKINFLTQHVSHDLIKNSIFYGWLGIADKFPRTNLSVIPRLTVYLSND